MPPEDATRTLGASTDKALTEAERACVSKCRPLKVSARTRTAGEPASFPALRSAAERLLPRPKDSASLVLRLLYTVVNAVAFNAGKAKNADDAAARAMKL